MKRNFTWPIVACMLITLGTTAQTTENFNARTGITTAQLKSNLQGHCWAFPDFDVNNAGWVPGIEGDGAMVSGTGNDANAHTGIYTPMLDVPGEISVAFNYSFNGTVGNGVRRWFKIYLADMDNVNAGPFMDSVEIMNVTPNTVYTYNKHFSAVGSGIYKVYINYQGIGGSTRIAIDNLAISAPLLYASGCNDAPVAQPDVITGSTNHQAGGQVMVNDSDANHDYLQAYLVTGSPDGTVTLNTDGTFNFTPNPGWAGNSTTFTYKICDGGYTSLCSNDVTVTLNFPTNGTLPVSLVDLKGLYKNDGNVELSWITNFEQNTDRFEIERTLDGVKWTTVGTLKAQGTSGVRKSYSFIDEVGRNTANKKDIYYRLRQIDLDTRVSVSRILIVRVYNTRSLKMVSITPNPAKNDIAVNVQLNEASVIVMKIFNTTGVEILRKSAKSDAGSASYLLDGSSKLTPGMYVLEVTINSKERMIVQLIKE